MFVRGRLIPLILVETGTFRTDNFNTNTDFRTDILKCVIKQNFDEELLCLIKQDFDEELLCLIKQDFDGELSCLIKLVV